jgi:uncharacterized membrane protein YkvA (DUF1232 family)
MDAAEKTVVETGVTPDVDAGTGSGDAASGPVVEVGVTSDVEAGTGDPFPRARFGTLVGHIPRYLRLAWGLAGEPRLSRRHKVGVLAAAGYLASPVDLVPGLIPVFGQLDDLAVALLALRAALRALDPVTRERQLAAVGLAPADLDEDLGALAVTAAWLARRGIALGQRLAALAAVVSLTAGRAGARAVRRGAPVVTRSGGRLARTTGRAFVRAGGAGRDLLARRGSRGAVGTGPNEADPASPAAEDGSGPAVERG